MFWCSWNTLLGWATRMGRSKLVADLEARMKEEGIEGDVFTNNIRLQVGLVVGRGFA